VLLKLLKLLLVCVIFVPVLMLVLVANVHHSFESLYRQVAVMVSLSPSVHTTYNAGVVFVPVDVLVGASLL